MGLSKDDEDFDADDARALVDEAAEAADVSAIIAQIRAAASKGETWVVLREEPSSIQRAELRRRFFEVSDWRVSWADEAE